MPRHCLIQVALVAFAGACAEGKPGQSAQAAPPARDGKEMRDIVAYLAFMSRGVAPPGEVPGQGLPKMTPLAGDTVRGMQVYAGTCARCHGPDGGGTVVGPPLWGPESFNVGAG